jgi:hypothetical protein
MLEQRDASFNTSSILLVTIGITYAILMLASGPQVLDPMVRHDDFPALLAEPADFYIKTLEEGRWLNYWWHLRGWVSPAWVNFAVYQLFWATYAGAAAVNACDRNAPFLYIIAMALMIVVSLPALLISTWFNTFIPGFGLVALFALLATRFSPRVMRLLLLVFVPITLMAYTTYPLLLLAVCLTTREVQRSWRDLLVLMTVFVISFALGLLVIYSLNYLEHGVFGIPIAAWRNPAPAHDLASMVANLDLVLDFLKVSAMEISLDETTVMVIHGLALFGGLIYLARVEPWVTLYIFTGLAAGIGLQCLQIVMIGVIVPTRALSFVWVLYSILCVRVALASRNNGRVITNVSGCFLLITVMIYLIWMWDRYFTYTHWQSETRELAVQAGDGAGPIYVIGPYKTLPSAVKAGIMGPRGLQLRLKYLTGRTVFICDETQDACKYLPKETQDNTAITAPTVRQMNDWTEIHLPTGK